MLCNLCQYILDQNHHNRCGLKLNILVIYIVLHGIRALRLTTIHIFFFFLSMEAINSSSGAVVPSHFGFMSIKLDRTNYPLWLAQIVPILKSKNLMGFVTGTNPCPPEFKCNTNDTLTIEVDPRYVTWHQQD